METPLYLSVDDIYRDPILSEDDIAGILNTSLAPRPSTMLYDKMEELGLGRGHHLLDIGCRDARHTCTLVERYACKAFGVDPVDDHIARALNLVEERKLAAQVFVQKGRMEQLSFPAGRFDYIWCRDMLNHLPDLHRGLAEAFRVLRSGGQMLVYQTFATALLEPSEAVRLYPPLAIVRPEHVNQLF